MYVQYMLAIHICSNIHWHICRCM